MGRFLTRGWFLKSRATKPGKQFSTLSPVVLEDRTVPALFTASIDPAIDNPGAITQLANFINSANITNEPDTIVLWPGAKYSFTTSLDANEGANALPSVIQDGAGKNAITIQGNGATFFRDTAGSNKFRFLRVSGINAALIVNDLTFQGGDAQGSLAAGSGGAILASANATLTVNDSVFTGNNAQAQGGAVAVVNGSNGSASTFTRTVFSANTTAGQGGALMATSFGSSTLIDCQVLNNTSTGGAGGVAGNGFLVYEFTRTTFSGNVGTTSGAFEGAEATFTQCSVLDNKATTGSTGGINGILANIYVGYSTVANNIGQSTVGSGGGINGSKVTIVNSTVHNNTAAIGGGVAGSTVILNYATVTGNISTFGIASPGGVSAGTTLTMSHSIVAGNTNISATSELADISTTGVTSKGFNIIGAKPAAVTLLSNDKSGTGPAPFNPQLGPLQNNGGLTLSRVPLAGSPAINMGDTVAVFPSTVDQRGYPRIVGTNADAGAAEVQATNSVGLVSGNLQSAKITGAFANNLRVVVRSPNGAPVSGVTVAFTGPAVLAGPEFSGQGTSGKAVTDATGQTNLPVQANATAGVYTVNASVGGLPPLPLTLRNTNFQLTTPPSFGVIALNGGDNQSALVGQAFTTAASIKLTNVSAPVANYPVTFTSPVGGVGATFSNGGSSITVLTDINGVASTTFTANTKAGTGTFTASASGYGQITFTHTNKAGDAATLTAVSGSGQSQLVNGTFTLPFVVLAVDAFGNLSPNQVVTFTPPATGASAMLNPLTATTDVNGLAKSTTAKANSVAGIYQVTASVGAVSTVFEMQNLSAPSPPPPANTPPAITAIANTTTTSGTPTATTPFVVYDNETPPGSLTVSIASDNTTVIPVSGVVITGSGNTRNVTVTPAAGKTGFAKITLTVTDAGALTASTSFTVTVNAPVQTPPTITPIGNQTVITGGVTGPLGFVVGDAQTTPGNLTVTAASSNTTLLPVSAIVFGGSGANRTVTLNPVLAQTGSATVTLTVTDENNETAQTLFVLTVTPPPATPPSISDVADLEVTMNKSSAAIPFFVTDNQTPANQIVVTATSSNTTLLPNAGIVLGGSGNFRTVTLTPTTTQSGTAVITLTATNLAGQTATDTFTMTVPTIVPPPAVNGFIAGTSAGIPGVVQQYSVSGVPGLVIVPFDPAFTQGVTVARADFNGDGVPDVAAGTGPGVVAKVRVFDGLTGIQIGEVTPFSESTFTGGVFVAAGDITGDGKAELVVTPDRTGGPRVTIYGGTKFDQLSNFFGITDPNFRGGARAAVGDLNNDGKADVAVAAGFTGGPRVAAYSGASMTATGMTALFPDFFAFEPALRNGVFVAIGDINGDGFAELVAGAGPGGAPRITAFNGKTLTQQNGTLASVADFFAGNVNDRNGIRVAVINADGDNNLDILTGSGSGAANVQFFFGKNALFGIQNPGQSFTDLFTGSTNGVFVG